MKLLRISINGFKSFADKVNIEIPDGITGIVGPNGSGKSNIVDAIRFVLGEQSLKGIRSGSSISDLIFSGSKKRSPLTRAWVALTIDNSEHYLKSDLTEIEIKRIVYATNENEYYLNGSQVRLKDITDLFIDSGSSVNSLSIISQGKVSDIINSRPEEKRVIIEQAAGVLKYKKRKEETLRKLEKTNDNLSKINLIIDELSINLEPLKEQSIVASKYLELKSDLAKTEISLLTNDIENANQEYLELKNKKITIENEILTIDNTSLIESSKIDTLKLELLNIEDNISKKSEELYNLNNELMNLTTEKQLMIERQKYNVSADALNENIIALKEKFLKTKNNQSNITEEIKLKKEELSNLNKINDNLANELKTLKIKRDFIIKEINEFNKEKYTLKNKIEIINNDLNNNLRLPLPVKQILNNKRLEGIHDIIGNLIQTENDYTTLIDIALGYNANVIVVSNELAAKNAISYLKSNVYGRATFYPLNIIKARGVDSNTLLKIKDDHSFIGLASDLVQYNSIYRNIILNQLGNVIVVDNLINANRIGKLINHLYKIVTLEGDVILPGGSITGGSTKNSTGLLHSKKELAIFAEQVRELELKLKANEQNLTENNNNIKILEEKIFASNNKISLLNELILRKENENDIIAKNIISIENEINGNQGVLNNSIDQEVDNILNSYYQKNGIKEKLELELIALKNQRSNLQSEISSLEVINRNQNANHNKLLTELKNIEITLTKLENRLDNSLLRLNEEYSMTFEKAKNESDLDIDINDARIKVTSLKQNIKALGEVNTGSINEYERINTRYIFLKTQQQDLQNAINDLLNIINELDITMEEKLKSTFKELNEEFNSVFKKLFKGGEASLILNNEEDILNSGLEIKAVPPGKEIKNIKLLSGGEASLTAIALLFSILNIRTVPFCVLDEVEAHLDDANVDTFGQYLQDLNSKTQFIIITHKKRTMEYTDNLYGITMQESGVSKLVSVKLND